MALYTIATYFFELDIWSKYSFKNSSLLIKHLGLTFAGKAKAFSIATAANFRKKFINDA